MQFVLRRLSDPPCLLGEASWRSLEQPSGGLANFLELQIGLMLGMVALLLWAILQPGFAAVPSALSLFLALAILLPLHEVSHAVAFPRALRSPQLSLAVWPCCVQYEGLISRDRYLMVLATPLLVVTLLPLAAVAAIGPVFAPLPMLSLVNALASGGDILAIILVLAQIPADAMVRVRRDGAHWKRLPEAAAIKATAKEPSTGGSRGVGP